MREISPEVGYFGFVLDAREHHLVPGNLPPRIGDERGEARPVGARDDVGVDGVVVAADGALVLLGGVARRDAARRPAPLIRGAGHQDLVVAVEDAVQIGGAVRAAGTSDSADQATGIL